METPTQKIRKELKESKGRVILGKNIPVHWGDWKITRWKIIDSFGCGDIGMDSFPTKNEAIDEYFKNREYYDKLVSRGRVVICPQIKHEGALINPYSIGWELCVDPFTQENAGLK